MNREFYKCLAIGAALLSLISCGNASIEEDSFTYTGKLSNGDMIPDFSHVGYHYGDEPIPEYPVVRTVSAPSGDATSLIQAAINETEAGAILLKAGVYQISGTLNINKSNIVLRGEGNNTVLYALGTTQKSLITLGTNAGRVYDAESEITPEYTPVGQMYVEVADPSIFAKGDEVVIMRPASEPWIKDLKMDQIAQNASGSVVQWSVSGYTLYWERVVMKVEGSKIWLDNPVVMGLEKKYSTSKLIKYHYHPSRIKESGVENLKCMSQYNKTITEKYNGEIVCTDEDHAWMAVNVKYAEHCWVKNVTDQYFGYALCDMTSGAKNITVQDCVSTEPISVITGSRRYAYHISNGQLCLVKNCTCDKDRHNFIMGARVGGPNVFTRCTATNAYEDVGPHQRWSTGVLYDNIKTNYQIRIQDRQGMGTGHGWTGANQVLWNCEGSEIVVQSPWVSGQNWSIGSIGKKTSGSYSGRPDGIWISKGTHVKPESLYEEQMANNHTNVWVEIGK